MKTTFQNRFEKKYLVPSSELSKIVEAFSGCLIPDPYSANLNNGYYNQSIYYDTANFRFYREKTEGLNPVFTQLSEKGVQVMSMRNKSNRLEELFVRLVESAKQAG